MKVYPIAFEVRGDLGMFADPLSSSEATSHPIPPPSACIGMISSVAYLHGVKVDVVAVATLKTPRWTSCAFNSSSPQRIKFDQQLQIREALLESPAYHVLAVCSKSPYDQHVPAKWKSINQPHAMQAIFLKRLHLGQSYHPVCLGRKELLATYMGPPRTPISTAYTSVIPSMTLESLENSRIKRKIAYNLEINQGVAYYDPSIAVMVENGILRFADDELHQKSLDPQLDTRPKQ